MIDVKFYDSVDDGLLQFAVVVARHRGKWVLCKHRQRDTYECPGGHREPGEDIADRPEESCGRRRAPRNIP
ncbi:8-oxo-dGTP diphosphatase [Sporobacter termitidis DSM 10068]|uniref:8-oxo-dGTP diphosphatase n=1 Tax=Sporobacter termitidis DSM 10068 TaxID=1123282 RepID=A0A1M5YA86_9FIRM|nr:8-oxo-dGTP diphosphatase [Sporobacter termitidis DSM 10068]